ncbi:hypothetical protein RND71_002858 [Anisodus tanguticus]|uniref:Uncharacterized protein n=1 Tax=Anisodus tanguticus TaxID=243964 RepID=A0AAE1SWV0_9SOLA|nr:hypothetical protein RND71_002858 [Anisodus tanguticus]
MLRNLIPHTDQKRDTASFLFEVIQCVQYLQDTVQKYEGSHQPWSSEPTKLMPWRNSHWRAQSFPANPQALKNGTDTGPTYSGMFDENLSTVTSSMQVNQQNPLESHPGGDVSCRSTDQEKELASRAIATTMPLQASMPLTVHNDNAFCDSLCTPAYDECPSTTNALNNQEFMIEGGTISISNTYSQGLLDSLTQVLQTAGLGLSQATISVQINLGKRQIGGWPQGHLLLRNNLGVYGNWMLPSGDSGQLSRNDKAFISPVSLSIAKFVVHSYVVSVVLASADQLHPENK